MATYVGWTGHIDADGFAKDIQKGNMSYAKAYQEFMDAYNARGKGLGGFTKNDANNLKKMAQALTTQYGKGIDTSSITATLDWIVKNNYYNDSNALMDLESSMDAISPKALTGSTTGEVKKDANTGQAVVTKGKNTGTNLATGKKVSTTTKTTTTTNTPKSTGGSGGSYSGGSSGNGSVNNAYYESMLNDLKKQLDELKNPKVWTAAELAKLHNVEDQYNYDKILQKYNDATNQYYQDAVTNQLMNNTAAEKSNSVYANRLINDYLSSYNSAAPTAVGKGTRAANALSSNIYADLTNEETSSNLQSIVNSYLENQKNELANNPILARQEYNNMGNMLLQLGANYNTSEVQNYINALNAYDTAYSGIRNAQNNLASTAAAAYQNNANAALANNAYRASRAKEDTLMRAYQLKYGNENNAWQKAYNNDKADVSTIYTQNYNS